MTNKRKEIILAFSVFLLIFLILTGLGFFKIYLYKNAREEKATKGCLRFEEYGSLNDTKLYICTKWED